MNAFTILTLLGALATIFSFLCGVRAMNRSGDVMGGSSPQWMIWRVIFQAATFAVILSAPLSH